MKVRKRKHNVKRILVLPLTDVFSYNAFILSN